MFRTLQERRKYYYSHKERELSRLKAWKKNNPEKVKEQLRKYRKNNTERLSLYFKLHRENAKKLKINGRLFLFKRSNGYYYLYFTDNLTQKRRSISTKAKVKSQALNFLNNFKSNTFVCKKNSEISDTYIKQLIYANMGLRYCEIPQTLINLYKTKLQLTRLIRKK